MCVKRDTGEQRAVKVLRKSHMDEDEKKMLFNEINILKGLVSFMFYCHGFLFGKAMAYLLIFIQMLTYISSGPPKYRQDV